MWRVYHIAGQRYFKKILSDAEKMNWENHPKFQGQYRFEPTEIDQPQKTISAPAGVNKEEEEIEAVPKTDEKEIVAEETITPPTPTKPKKPKKRASKNRNVG